VEPAEPFAHYSFEICVTSIGGNVMLTYKKRLKYKYILVDDCYYKTGVKVKKPGDFGYLIINEDGDLTVKKGYAWDGPSGPTIDTSNFMRGSLIHDALYQLMREKKIDQEQRKIADQVLHDICLDCGMSRLRAWLVFKAVRLAGAKSARPDILKAL
jgi:Protein of unknown function (DUF1353)